MAYGVNETFVLYDDKDASVLEIFMNNKDAIVFMEPESYDAHYGFFATFSKDDWIAMRAFIDSKFNIE